MEMFVDILTDAIKDTLYLIPFLFVTYVAMEWLETKTESQAEARIKNSGALGPVIGSALGLVPQCGFSAAASTLYAGRVITRGTLIAVFLATSDEMLPIFLAKAVPLQQIFQLLAIKFLIGLVAGLAVDFILNITNKRTKHFKIHELCEQEKCHCDHEHEEANHTSAKAKMILKSSLKHTLQVVIFVFIVNFLLSAAIQVVGEEALSSLMKTNEWVSVIISAFVGLIPNCAASVAIADLWADGILSYGAMLSGLLVSAGIGLLVLFRTNKEPKRNVSILLTLLFVGIACGLLANCFTL